jgi:hypothetical protein
MNFPPAQAISAKILFGNPPPIGISEKPLFVISSSDRISENTLFSISSRVGISEKSWFGIRREDKGGEGGNLVKDIIPKKRVMMSLTGFRHDHGFRSLSPPKRGEGWGEGLSV